MNRTAPAATIATLLLVVLCGSPREAWAADYLFMPFIGGAFARETVFPTGVEQGEDSTHVIFGGSASWLSSGILGVEGEFAYAPRFFERDNPLDDILDSNLITLSGNVIAAVPLSVSEYSLRPYAIGGVGFDPFGITYRASRHLSTTIRWGSTSEEGQSASSPGGTRSPLRATPLPDLRARRE